MDNQQQFAWIFCGPKGRFPGGVFLSLHKAESWVAHHKLTGVLTRYPLDMGSFDWAEANGFVNERLLSKADPDFIGSFSSASFEHFHYEDGVRE
jgi:hypothetical protein